MRRILILTVAVICASVVTGYAEELPVSAEKASVQVSRTPANSPVNSKKSMRVRIVRQYELSKKASKLLKQVDELGDGNPSKAHELWDELERVEGELRLTFGQPQTLIAPNQPHSGSVVQQSAPAPGALLLRPGSSLNPVPHPDAPAASGIVIATQGGAGVLSGAALNVVSSPASSGPTNREIQNELQAQRRQIEELQVMVKKLIEVVEKQSDKAKK